MGLPIQRSWQDKTYPGHHHLQTVQSGTIGEERVGTERVSWRKLGLPGLHTWGWPRGYGETLGQLTTTKTL